MKNHGSIQISPAPPVLISMMGIAVMGGAGMTAQAGSPASLPPAAQEAVNLGFHADKNKDYLAAIAHFREALRIAPATPEILFYLGVEESKIPGRELRAMAWLGACLSVRGGTLPISKVETQIGGLKAAHQETLSRLIQSAEDAATAPGTHGVWLGGVVREWTRIKDFPSALRAAAHIKNPGFKNPAYAEIAEAQAVAGDFEGALSTLDLIQDGQEKHFAQNEILQVQAAMGDIKGAQGTWKRMVNLPRLSWRECTRKPAGVSISEAQVKAGDPAGARETRELALENVKLIDKDQRDYLYSALAKAQTQQGDFLGGQKTLDLMENTGFRNEAQANILGTLAEAGMLSKALDLVNTISDPADQDNAKAWIAIAQAKRGDWNGANKTAAMIQGDFRKTDARKDIAKAREIKSSDGRGTTVAEWVETLEETDPKSECPLKMEIFLDLRAHIKALPPSEDPETLAKGILGTTDRLLRAQVVIERLLSGIKGNKAPRPANRGGSK